MLHSNETNDDYVQLKRGFFQLFKILLGLKNIDYETDRGELWSSFVAKISIKII